MKNVIKLNEEQLNRIIKESVETILNEDMEEGFWNNFKTGAKTMGNSMMNGNGIANSFSKARKNFNTQGEYDNIQSLISQLTKLVDERKLNPQMTVAQLIGGKYNNNKFGTLSAMSGNRMSQMRNRGLN